MNDSLISLALARNLADAYFELFAAVENGVDNETFFRLREKHRNLAKRIAEENEEQKNLRPFRDAATQHVVEGSLEVDETALVSHGDDGAYVQAWIWIADSEAGFSKTG